MYVCLYSTRALRYRHHRSNDLLAASATECLVGLYRFSASIAEHEFPPRDLKSEPAIQAS
jgi:hypothetical protein